MAKIMIYVSKYFVCTCEKDECNILQLSSQFSWQAIIVPYIFIFTNCLIDLSIFGRELMKSLNIMVDISILNTYIWAYTVPSMDLGTW